MAVRQNTDSFVYGVDEYPDWFKVNSEQGKVKYIYTDSGELLSTEVATLSGFEQAKKGDTIMRMGNNMVVVPAATAKTYGVN